MFLGGTGFVGPPAVSRLLEAGHEVAIAHSGMHETSTLPEVEHLHGSRDELLGEGGPVEAWRPEAIVDTLAGGASAVKAGELAECATRCGVGHLIVTSSMDVYQHCVDAGLADGSGTRSIPVDPIPLTENARLRTAPYPGAQHGHDNVAMEAALHDAGRVTALRCGAIYGPHESTRERDLVERISRGERRLELPDGGVQIWHRVAVERVARAISASLEHAPEGFWACNVVDPYDWDYAGLAGKIAEILDWEWEPIVVPFEATGHPWQTRHPVLCSDERLRAGLKVTEPDPLVALKETVQWLSAHRVHNSA